MTSFVRNAGGPVNKDVQKATVSCMLGEGAIWSWLDDRFYWVDILRKKLYSCDLEYNTSDSVGFDLLPTCPTLTKTQRQLFLAVEDGFGMVDLRLPHSNLIRVPIISSAMEAACLDFSKVRFNDGKVCRNGVFHIGTMDRDDGKQDLGSIFQISTGSPTGVELKPILSNGIGISNGMAFSPNNSTFYFSDSCDRRMKIYSSGINKDIDMNLLETNQQGATYSYMGCENGGTPDGATVDLQGRYWSALWGGDRIEVFDMAKGKFDLIGSVEIPKENISDIHIPNQRDSTEQKNRCPTCCTFGGKDLDRLLVTTASVNDKDGTVVVFENPGEELLSEKATGLRESPVCFI